MKLPVLPPIEPMLAKPVAKIPVADGMTYEPKWDGFRCIIFRDGDEVELASRGGKSMTRYFPEVVNQVRDQFPERCVVDCELVVIRHDTTPPKLDFELLGQRIHPAASRVNMLAETTPASVIAFDLLAIGDESLMELGYAGRRARLEEALGSVRPPVHVTAVTKDVATAEQWFTVLEGAGLDGLIAKEPDTPYTPNKRLMFKIKHARTADVVACGFRWHKDGPIVGSILLGLYDAEGRLHHVGVSASFSKERRAELVQELEPYRTDVQDHPWAAWAAQDGPHVPGTQRMPGALSRWSAKKDLGFVPIRPELVIEVGYDAMEGERFRHTAQFKRWRPDRDPASCTYEQLERPVRVDVIDVLAGRV
jgi:ATP-dependent DNA ligase